MGHAFEMLHAHDYRFVGGQCVDRPANAPYGVERVELGREGDQRGVVGCSIVERAGGPTSLPAVDVDGDALRDRREP